MQFKGWKRHSSQSVSAASPILGFLMILGHIGQLKFCSLSQNSDDSIQFSYSGRRAALTQSQTVQNPSRQRLNSVQPGTTAHLGPRRVVDVLNCLAAAEAVRDSMTGSEIHGPRAEINSYAVSNNMGMMPCPSCTKVLSSKTKK